MRACVSAYEDGQQLMRGSELRRAREQLLVCARPPCPRELWGDCMRWLGDVDRKMPSVVLAARDGRGRDVTDVSVTMDGNRLMERLDPHAIEADPGEHAFVFRWGDRAIEQRVLLREGEKSRLVLVELEPARSPPALFTPPSDGASGERSATTRSAPVAGWVVGGVGVVALGAFGYFGLTGRSGYLDLERSCSPHCSSSETSSVRTKLLVADVSLGVSLVAFGVAAYLLLFTTSPTRTTRTTTHVAF